MSDAGPPPKTHQQPRRYEIPERFRPAPRPEPDDAATAPLTAPSGPPRPAPPGGPPLPPHSAPPPGPSPESRRPSTKVVVLAIAAVVVVVAVALGAYFALSGGGGKKHPTAATPSAAPSPSPSPGSIAASATGTADSPTTEAESICRGLGGRNQILDLLITAGTPAPPSVLPTSFVPPRSGTTVAVCRARFRPEESERVAAVAVYAGVRMPQYVALLNSLRWQLVSRSSEAPGYSNGLGVRVTIVQSGSQLVLIVGTPAR